MTNKNSPRDAMSLQLPALAAVLIALCSCDSKQESAANQKPAPETQQAPAPPSPATRWTLQAEDKPKGEVIKDPSALGGAYVFAQKGNYQEVFAANVPDSLPPEVTLFVLRRGGAVQLKSISGGKQQELAWSYGQTDEFEWKSLGRYPLAKLGQSMILIRGADSKPIEIDAIYISADPSPDLASLLPPLPDVEVSVDWTSSKGEITRDHFGINGFGTVNPKVSADPAYLKSLSQINPGILRVHNGNLHGDSAKNAASWVDDKNRCWDKPRVLASLAPVRGLPMRVMPCISSWPSWMDADGDGMLDPGQEDAFAEFCADLVRIVNEDQSQVPILWWEITNELDGRYYINLQEGKKPDRLDELVKIYRLAAMAMKKADPRIKTGGPSALNSYKIDFHTRFIEGTVDLLDFYSAHLYVSGNKGDSDSGVFRRASSPYQPMGQILKALQKASPDRKIELLLNEYNISWDWKQRDPRMVDSRGAIWDAWFAIEAIKGGVDGLASWNDCDGIYGKMNPKYELRASGKSLAICNQMLLGDWFPATIRPELGTNPPLCAMAVQTQEGERRVLIINRSNRSRTINTPLKSAVGFDEKGISNHPASDQITIGPISYLIINL